MSTMRTEQLTSVGNTYMQYEIFGKEMENCICAIQKFAPYDKFPKSKSRVCDFSDILV